MFWDDLIRRWRRDYKVVSPRLLRGVGGHVAVLPAPRRRRQTRLLIFLVILMALGAALLASSGGISITPGDTEGTPAGVVTAVGALGVTPTVDGERQDRTRVSNRCKSVG